MFKETLVCVINPLKKFLNRLRVQGVSVDALNKVFFHTPTVDILAVQTVIAFL
jgi:hypothetical protein